MSHHDSGSIENAANGTQYAIPTTDANVFQASQLAFLVAPAACMVRSLTVNAITTNVVNPIEAETTTFTVINNEVVTAMSCAITNGTTNNATYSCSDSTDIFSVAQGGRISLQFSETLSDDNYEMINFGTTLCPDHRQLHHLHQPCHNRNRRLLQRHADYLGSRNELRARTSSSCRLPWEHPMARLSSAAPASSHRASC